jgi:hypothetical protein
MILLACRTERYTQVTLNADGTLTMVTDSTNAIEIDGAWRESVSALISPRDVRGSSSSPLITTVSTIHQGENKIGLILERVYSEKSDSTYSMTRIYEGEYKASGRSIRGEGR